MLDLNDPTLDERLRRRTAEGRFEISESQLVSEIRLLQAQGNHSGVQRLSVVLLERCKPMFLRHSQGLSHRPELREDAIANMAAQLLNEVLNPQEVFLLQNFVHYLRCLGVDEFKRILRQEGLLYRHDDDGNPSGKPQHVPRYLIDALHPAPADDEGGLTADVANPGDQYEELHAQEESMRILMYLQDGIDRKIVVLRAIEKMKWDDIARLCGYTERTVRLRYERARSYLRTCLQKESEQGDVRPQRHVGVQAEGAGQGEQRVRGKSRQQKGSKR